MGHRRHLIEAFGFVLTVAASFVYSYGTGPDAMPLVPALVVSFGAGALVLASFHRPVAAFAGAVVLAVVLPLLGSTFEMMTLVLVLVGYRVIADTRLRWPPVAGLLFIALVVNDQWLRSILDRDLWDPAVLRSVFLTGLVTYIGVQSRILQEQRNQLVLLHGAERRRAVLDERRRIALDLHDVAAHHLTALVVRSRLAERIDSPGSYRELAPFSASTATEALAAIRHVVDVLHDDEAPTSPQPGIEVLDDVVVRLSTAGLTVERIGDVPRGLPRHVEGALVRIGQEALSNVLRHRGPGRAWLVLGRTADAATLSVEDDGPSPGPAATIPVRPGARGVTGMVERAEACGGHLVIEQSSRGGWAVRAELPLSAAGP